jgi:hypothetical protein
MAINFGDLEAVVLREERVFFVAARLGEGGLVFLVVDIGDTFEKQEGEYVGFEIGGVHRAAENVGSFPEVGFELAQGEGGCGPLGIGRFLAYLGSIRHSDCVRFGNF